MRRFALLATLLLVGVASAVLVEYVSNKLTFQTEITKPPIELTVLGNELENATEVIAGNTYTINVSTVNLANNPIPNLRTIITCSADPAFQSADELKIQAYFIDENTNERDPPGEGYYNLTGYLEDGNITFYIPSYNKTWIADVDYNTTGYFLVTTAPNLQNGTSITCSAQVNIVEKTGGET
ncbi:MAG: hypothetical protein DRJ31_03175 [Candidatus Methanomethylicota archaeon]|uniref:Uncharacterized protein n=1 Tax=Thermoproteota archaeon TaxID=2056631 RepID=A0A497ERD7_9CREN|nr:MAG: hypothetical protein DRJ31_03175 [Candidatus Verstraetearchaeota archaeon]